MKLSEVIKPPADIVLLVKLDHGTIELRGEHLFDNWALMFYTMPAEDAELPISEIILDKRVPSWMFDDQLGFTSRDLKKFLRKFSEHLRKHSYDEALNIIKGLDEIDNIRVFMREFLKV